MDIKNSFKGLRSKDTDVKAKSWAIYVWLMVILMSAIDFFVNPNINKFFESLAMGIFGGALFAILPYMFIKLIKSEKKNFFFVLISILIFLFFISYQANNKIATREENQEIKRVAECYKNLPSSSRVDIDCSGTKTYPDGSKYVGEWKNNSYHGNGTSTYPDGSGYVGEWKNHVPHGQGTETLPDGSKYVGKFRDGSMHGYGKFSVDGEVRYVGEWKNNKYHGNGTKTYPDGSKYVGEFENDKPHGKGTITAPGGNKYIGQWKNNKYHGNGTFTNANGTKYVGEFKNGKPHGNGTQNSSNGTKYVGEFKNGKPHGNGTMNFSDGKKYVGKFKDGKFLGDDKARGGWTKKNIKAWEEVYISAYIENQKKSDYNKKISLNGQKEFCYCMSDFIMNRVSVSEVNNEKRKYEVTEAGGNYCAEKLIKKSLEAF